VIKSKKPASRRGVEPADSPVISGGKPGRIRFRHRRGFIPKNLNTSIIDETLTVTNDDSFTMARRLAKEEGILCGISSGANVWAAIQYAKRPRTREAHRYFCAIDG